MTTKQVIFIDPTLQTTLAAALPPDIEIQFITDPSQLAQWSQTHTGYDAIHILSHGSPGAVRIGANIVTNSEWAALGAAFNPNGDLLLYGCDVGAGDSGQAFLASVANLTGADVAASDDLTGAAALGGDWELEVRQGQIDIASVAVANYQGVLADGQLIFGDGSGGEGIGGVYGSNGGNGGNGGGDNDVLIGTDGNDVVFGDGSGSGGGGGGGGYSISYYT